MNTLTATCPRCGGPMWAPTYQRTRFGHEWLASRCSLCGFESTSYSVAEIQRQTRPRAEKVQAKS